MQTSTELDEMKMALTVVLVVVLLGSIVARSVPFEVKRAAAFADKR
jgi:hypothetical protein